MIRVGFVLSLKTYAGVFFCYKDNEKTNSTALVNGAIIYIRCIRLLLIADRVIVLLL